MHPKGDVANVAQPGPNRAAAVGSPT
jgi:hypothetical protein